MSWLVNTIEAEIIPRLVASHGSAAPTSSASLISVKEVQDFTRIALQSDSATCHRFVEGMLSRGISLRCIYLELLGPAARELDGMWARDECDFTEVTVALWRIQQVMYDLSPDFRGGGENQKISGENRKIMLAPVPGSQHTLGILMVAEFFHKAGWSVWSEPMTQTQDMIQAVQNEWFDLVGISIGSEPQLFGLKELINELRKASQNPTLIIMAGGPLIVHHPEHAKAVGADIHAMDAEDAVRVAEKTVASRPANNRNQFFERGS